MKSSHLTHSLVAGWLVRSSQAQVKVPPEFKVEAKWQIEIQHTLATNAALVPTDAPIWDIDLYQVARTPGTIDYLRRQNPNVFIICYFNAGAVQVSDCDYNTTWNTPPYRNLLGNPLSGFPDERWVNIKNQTARDLIKRRITLANTLGCDGVDPDNIDAYGVDQDDELPARNKTGFNISEQDNIAFVRELATHAHGLTTRRNFTLLIGQKNAPEITTQVAAVLDFAVLEDCKGLNEPPPENPEDDPNFCSVYQTPYISAGKPVFSIEYPSTLGNPTTGACNPSGAEKAQYDASCDATKGNGRFSTVLKIQGDAGELNGCTQYCGGGVGTGVVETATDAGRDGVACPAGSTF